jgi:hypothetical protein
MNRFSGFLAKEKEAIRSYSQYGWHLLSPVDVSIITYPLRFFK